MKIILIIQSLAILALAYYVYTIRQEKPTPEAVTEEVMVVATSTEETVPVVATSTVEAEAKQPAPIAAPNDAGMEWPTFEGDLQAQ